MTTYEEADVAGLLANDKDIRALVAQKSAQIAAQRDAEAKRAAAAAEFKVRDQHLKDVLGQKNPSSKDLEAALKAAREADEARRG